MSMQVLEGEELFAAPRLITSYPARKYPQTQRTSYLWSFIAALMFHGVLWGGGLHFFEAPEYGIESYQGGIEISLTAAPAHAEDQRAPLDTAMPPDLSKDTQEESVLAAPETQPQEAFKDVPPPRNFKASGKSDLQGDGSSPVPGVNETTFYSAGGASSDGMPGYLKNPPPDYPAESVARREEGLVLLDVAVARAGRPSQVGIKTSSGYPRLDRAAREAVQDWRFKPGKLGFMETESRVVIPIRFRIEDALKDRFRA